MDSDLTQVIDITVKPGADVLYVRTNPDQVLSLDAPERTRVKQVIMGRPVRRLNTVQSGGVNDVIDAQGSTEGDVLVFREDTQKYKPTKLLDQQEVNGGQY